MTGATEAEKMNVRHEDGAGDALHISPHRIELVDPDLRELLQTFPPLDVNAGTLKDVRAGIAEALKAAPAVVDENVSRREVMVPRPDGGSPVRALLYEPAKLTGSLPVMLDIHGGGMVLGTPEMNEARNTMLVRETGFPVVSVDYRLAPETQAPGNVEDCYAALSWIGSAGGGSYMDPARILVIGESAGGGLAASLGLLARDRGEYAIKALFLLSPMLDDRTGSEPVRETSCDEYLWTRASNKFGWSALLGDAADRDPLSPYAVPARATNLSGMPPTFIDVGGLDLFLDEDVTFARRLVEAGVTVELHVYPRAFHGFQMASEAEISKLAFANFTSAIRRFAHA